MQVRKHPIPRKRRLRRRMMATVAFAIVLAIVAAALWSRLNEPTYEIREERLFTPPVHVIPLETEEPDVWVRYPVPLDDELQRSIEDICGTDIAPNVVMAVIMAESGGEAWAISDDGMDFGLMQIRETYHRERMERLGVTQLLDPVENVTVGVDILKELQGYGKPLEWTLMAYNGGIAYANQMMATGSISGYAAKVIILSESYLEGAQVMSE